GLLYKSGCPSNRRCLSSGIGKVAGIIDARVENDLGGKDCRVREPTRRSGRSSHKTRLQQRKPSIRQIHVALFAKSDRLSGSSSRRSFRTKVRSAMARSM